jgi:hypothetical protein
MTALKDLCTEDGPGSPRTGRPATSLEGEFADGRDAAAAKVWAGEKRAAAPKKALA